MSRPDLAVGVGANGEPGPGPGGRNRRPRRFSRGTRIALITVGVLLFLTISGILARYLSTENVERNHEWALMQAEARGDVPGMLAQLSGCRASASCTATVRADAVEPAAARRGGDPLDAIHHQPLAERLGRRDARGVEGQRALPGGAVRAGAPLGQLPHGHHDLAAARRPADRLDGGLPGLIPSLPQVDHLCFALLPSWPRTKEQSLFRPLQMRLSLILICMGPKINRYFRPPPPGGASNRAIAKVLSPPMADPTSTQLDVRARQPDGSRAARRLRRDGRVPGILYGGGERAAELRRGRPRAAPRARPGGRGAGPERRRRRPPRRSCSRRPSATRCAGRPCTSICCGCAWTGRSTRWSRWS